MTRVSLVGDSCSAPVTFVPEQPASVPPVRPTCAVLIRTFNSQATLPGTLESIDRQTHRPSGYVIVDSGSTDATLSLLPAGAIIHRFVGDEFSYAGSLNQGLDRVAADFVLVISSHTSLENENAVAFAIDRMISDERIGACYFCTDDAPEIAVEIIGPDNFTGFNGVWNTCAVIRMNLLRKRSFRTELFSAEDQDWSNWLLNDEGRLIGRLSGGGMRYNNPLRYPLRKRLNEHIAVALYVKPKMLRPAYLARVAYRIIRPVSTFRDRLFNLYLLANLVRCNFVKPRLRSRYY